MHSHDEIFHEDLFAETAGWTSIYADSRMTQRCRIEPRGAMYTETRLTIRAPVDADRGQTAGRVDVVAARVATAIEWSIPTAGSSTTISRLASTCT